jgi:hypothetical protein
VECQNKDPMAETTKTQSQSKVAFITPEAAHRKRVMVIFMLQNIKY